MPSVRSATLIPGLRTTRSLTRARKSFARSSLIPLFAVAQDRTIGGEQKLRNGDMLLPSLPMLAFPQTKTTWEQREGEKGGWGEGGGEREV